MFVDVFRINKAFSLCKVVLIFFSNEIRDEKRGSV